MKVKASDIQKELLRFARGTGSDIIIPNYYVGSYEMDVFKLNERGLITEYEIKVSRADLKNDFKKNKHNGWSKKTEQTNKHVELAAGRLPANRFFFVVPVDMVDAELMPRHCGVIFYDEGSLQIVRPAPLLHKNPVDIKFYKTLAIGLSWRQQHLRGRLSRMKHELEMANTRAANNYKYFQQVGGEAALDKQQ
jgi:hypothetical protein